MDRLGLQEGEVIQHSMVTNSIQRAQKKVEQNNYGVRKRLLEYDNEINKQREVVYQRRRDALFGTRVRLDLMNMFHSVAEQFTSHAGNKEAYEAFQENIVQNFGVPISLTADMYASNSANVLSELVYQELLTHYKTKRQGLQEKARQLISNLDPTSGSDYILLFFTDGQQRLDVGVSCRALIDTAGEAVLKELEKTAIISFIDQYWQEHLRHMDELRQSVQNAVYEQKDPLLIYKFEAYALFQRFLQKVNQAITGYLMKASLQAYKTNNALRASSQTPKRSLEESKQDILNLLDTIHTDPNQPVAQPSILKSQKIAGRNERVSVRYQDGQIKKDVKYKSVEADIVSGQCEIIEEI
jgi:preprotein translocase subunit SecA